MHTTEHPIGRHLFIDVDVDDGIEIDAQGQYVRLEIIGTEDRLTVHIPALVLRGRYKDTETRTAGTALDRWTAIALGE
jgi:hypothetical protein